MHTTRLLFKHIEALDKLESFISASGIDYYGARTTEEIFTHPLNHMMILRHSSLKAVPPAIVEDP